MFEQNFRQVYILLFFDLSDLLERGLYMKRLHLFGTANQDLEAGKGVAVLLLQF